MDSSTTPSSCAVTPKARQAVVSRRGRAHRFAVSLTFLATFLMAIAAGSVEAQAQTANVSVTFVLASNDGGGVDGSLGSISGQLRSRFGHYNSFRRVGGQRVSLSVGSSQNVGMPNGQSMTITLQGMSGSSYRLSVSLPGGGGTVTAPPGGIFFVAGPPYQGGELIVAIQP